MGKFRVFHALSGREDQMGQMHLDLVDHGLPNEKYRVEYLPCFSLNTIMKAIGVENVDFLSLDIEGGEWDVIESIDYDILDIGAVCVEWTAQEATKPLILSHLTGKNFVLTKQTDFDLFFLNRNMLNETNGRFSSK